MKPQAICLGALALALACVDIPDRQPLRVSENPNAASGATGSTGSSSGSGGSTTGAGGATGTGSGGKGGSTSTGAGGSGTGGSSGSTGAGGSIGGTGTISDRCVDDPLLIDDFEAEQPATCQGGGYFPLAYNDEALGINDSVLIQEFTQNQNGNWQYFTTEHAGGSPEDLGARGGYFSAEATMGHRFSSYAPGLACQLKWRPPGSPLEETFDASEYSGIEFYFAGSIDCGTEPSPLGCDHVWVNFTTLDSLEVPYGGLCDPASGAVCWNEYGAWVEISDNLDSSHSVSFAELGLFDPALPAAADAFNPENLVRISFTLGKDMDPMLINSFSFVVDNLRFTPSP